MADQSLSNRRGKSAADDISRHIVQHQVHILHGLGDLAQEINGDDYAPPGTAHARLRAAYLNALNSLVSLKNDILPHESLHRLR